MKTMAWPAALALVLVAANAAAMTPKDVYKKAGPAVTLILGSDDGKSGAGGTGSIITPEGKVLTNAHVVLNERNQPFRVLYVFLKPPKLTGDNSKDLVNRYKARVLSYSVPDELDLALLQIENPPPSLPTIPFGDPDDVEVGDEAIAIGHPEQGGLWTLTTGSISTVIANFNRVQGKDVFQTEASVNRGNSGGPLLDTRGDLIGINTMIARQGAGGVAITGVNFSLKSSVAVKWLASQGMGLAYAPRGQRELVVASAAEPARPATGAQAAGEPVEPSGAAGVSAATSASDTGTQVAAAQAEASASAAQPGEGGAAAGQGSSAGAVAAEPRTVAEQPQATIVVTEAPPKAHEVERLKDEGKSIGKQKGAEKLVQGKPLDPAKARPKYQTQKRPFSLDDLRRQQMKELEDIMDEMRAKTGGKKTDGLGLW